MDCELIRRDSNVSEGELNGVRWDYSVQSIVKKFMVQLMLIHIVSIYLDCIINKILRKDQL